MYSGMDTLCSRYHSSFGLFDKITSFSCEKVGDSITEGCLELELKVHCIHQVYRGLMLTLGFRLTFLGLGGMG
jgi:hypothetical protein